MSLHDGAGWRFHHRSAAGVAAGHRRVTVLRAWIQIRAAGGRDPCRSRDRRDHHARHCALSVGEVRGTEEDSLMTTRRAFMLGAAAATVLAAPVKTLAGVFTTLRYA